MPDLTVDQWSELVAYLMSADRLKDRIYAAIDKGSQQVSVSDGAVQGFLENGSHASQHSLWFQLGVILGARGWEAPSVSDRGD